MPRVKTFDKQKVLEQAMELFWEKGYAATSIQDLVSHLGINRASLYDTYGGKEELFRKSFTHYRKNGIERMTSFFANQPDVRKGFKILFEEAIEEAVQDPARKGCFAVNTATELIPGEEGVAKALLENKHALEELFSNYLKQGEESGQLKSGKDWEVIASMLYTYFNGLRVITKIEQNSTKQKQTVAIALSLLD